MVIIYKANRMFMLFIFQVITNQFYYLNDQSQHYKNKSIISENVPFVKQFGTF